MMPSARGVNVAMRIGDSLTRSRSISLREVA
jgi:hypothetical protein